MTSAPLHGHRAPPEETWRITASGADQYVLACTARRDARDDTFDEVLLYEAEIRELRKQLAWAESHSVTRTARYIRSRLYIMANVIATALAIIFWFQLNPTGRLFRVLLVKASQEATIRRSVESTDAHCSFAISRSLKSTRTYVT
ncbi:MAG: hypothetical protein V4550_04980 [Gemmatimonadota bacterium]